MLRYFVKCFILLYLIVQLCFPQAALAQSIPSNLTQPHLTQPQRQELLQIQQHLLTLKDLQQRGVISPDVVHSQQRYYLNQAIEITQHPLTLVQLTALSLADTPTSEGRWHHIKGFLTFVNIVLFTASILLVVALSWLCQLYLVPLLRRIPPVGYELLLYATCLASIVGGRFFSGDLGEWIALPGCLGYVGALSYTQFLHKSALEPFCTRIRIDLFRLSLLYLCLFWSVVAIIYHSRMIGFLAVIALEAFLGFVVVVFPLHYMLGFTDQPSTLRATAASFILLAFYLIVRILQIQLPYFSVFAPGLVFMGAFVYYIGLLILSSRWNQPANLWKYLGFQALTICSGIAALFMGSFWQLPTLQAIGGTFFFLYLLEKYFELPWQQKHLAWTMLGLACILYSTSLVAKQYPQYFLFMSQGM
ncbi:MAG TPA: hypothetical protein V6C65_01220 [Allocoleopsis sp.]